jgi:hypothetical protein
MGWAEAHFVSQSVPFQTRFAPAMSGLRHVIQGGTFDASGASPGADDASSAGPPRALGTRSAAPENGAWGLAAAFS